MFLMDSGTAQKLKRDFDDIEDALILRILWKAISDSKNYEIHLELNDSILGISHSQEILKKFQQKEFIEHLSFDSEYRENIGYWNWCDVTASHKFLQQYHSYLHQLPLHSSTKELKEVMSAISEEIRLQEERDVTECKLSYETLPNELFGKVNFYYALLLMELDGVVAIQKIKDKAEWYPTMKSVNKLYVHNLIFEVQARRILTPVIPKQLSDIPLKKYLWKNLRAEFAQDMDKRPRVYAGKNQLRTGGKNHELRPGDIRVLAALIAAQGRTIENYQLMDLLRPEAKDEMKQPARDVHDSINRLRSRASIDCIENVRGTGYKLI